MIINKMVLFPFVTLLFLAISFPLSAQNATPIFRSTDGGLSWQPSAKGFPSDDGVNAFLSFNGNFYAATEKSGLLISLDRGKTWLQTGKGLPAKINELASRGEVLFSAPWQAGVYVSFDGGQNWQERNFGLDDRQVSAFFPLGNAILVGTGTGIYYSWNDGQSWMKIYSGPQINDIVQMGNTLYAATPEGILISEDFGKQWTPVFSKAAVHDLYVSEYGIFALSYSQGIFKSTDGDTIWESCNNGLTDNLNISTLIQTGPQLLTGGGSGIHISTTQGLHWSKIKKTISFDVPIMRFFKVDDQLLLASIFNGNGC